MAEKEDVSKQLCCAKCKAGCKSYVECIKCSAKYHPSCAIRKNKKFKVISTNKINCCVNEDNDIDTETPERDDPLRTEIYLLKCIIEQKDAMIEELHEKLMLYEDIRNTMKILQEEKKSRNDNDQEPSKISSVKRTTNNPSMTPQKAANEQMRSHKQMLNEKCQPKNWSWL